MLVSFPQALNGVLDRIEFLRAQIATNQQRESRDHSVDPANVPERRSTCPVERVAGTAGHDANRAGNSAGRAGLAAPVGETNSGQETRGDDADHQQLPTLSSADCLAEEGARSDVLAARGGGAGSGWAASLWQALVQAPHQDAFLPAPYAAPFQAKLPSTFPGSFQGCTPGCSPGGWGADWPPPLGEIGVRSLPALVALADGGANGGRGGGQQKSAEPLSGASLGALSEEGGEEGPLPESSQDPSSAPSSALRTG